jgi:transcriptional regulator with XRE-family HTH domain
MSGLLRQGHFLGTKLKTLRKRNGLTLDELSARCVQLDPDSAPSVSYLSMIENGKRMPSADLLDMLARLFGKETRWFLDENTAVEPVPARRERGGLEAMPLEPAFLFSHELLQNALPELLSQTGTSGRQFAQLLIRVWQETHHNDFPDIERAAESVGRREQPLSLERLQGICKHLGLHIRWVEPERATPAGGRLRARFEAPDTVLINRNLRDQEERLRYDLAYFIGHRLLHNGDGLVSAHEASWSSETEQPVAAGGNGGMGAQDVLYAWRDFECSFFAGALLCARVPFRRFLVREAHRLSACRKLGVTTAVVMRRMTAVSPYRYWHYFDAYPPGFLRAVYRGNGIPLPWGNMSLVSDPCPRWAVFRLLGQAPLPKQASHQPMSQISVMQEGKRARLYCCHSIVTRDAARAVHVQSVGVDLVPALEAQGHDGAGIVAAVSEACRRGGGDAPIPAAARTALQSVSQVLNIHWIHDALDTPAGVICPRSGACPRTPRRCGSGRP